MVWDKNIPIGTSFLSIGDDIIRDNQAAAEAAIDLEHYFQTGGVQTGRHKFPRGTSTGGGNDRDTDPVAWQDGSLFLANDVRSGKHVVELYNGGAWDRLDVDPLDGSGDPTLPRTSERSLFKTCQHANWDVITATGSVPALLTIDYSGSPYKRHVITQDTQIQAPINVVAGKASTVELELVQDGVGNHAVSFVGSTFYAVGGTSPIIAIAANSPTTLYITARSDGTFRVSSEPGLGVI